MSSGQQPPTRLASEDVIINAPMSYAGSAQRIFRLRRRAEREGGPKLAAITTLCVLLTILAWAAVTCWYLIWGIWLIPYRLLRRGARKRKAELLRHRELLGTIQGSALASANAIITSQLSASTAAATVHSPNELIADRDRERAVEELRQHMMDGRLTTEEFETRLAAAQTAKTRREIEVARSDLPSEPARVTPETPGSAPA